MGFMANGVHSASLDDVRGIMAEWVRQGIPMRVHFARGCWHVIPGFIDSGPLVEQSPAFHDVLSDTVERGERGERSLVIDFAKR